MTRYLVELYQPRSGAGTLRVATERLAASAAELTGEGTPVRYLDTIFLPGDETCLHLLEAPCEADVRAVAERAAIEVDRVVLAEQLHPREESRTGSSETEGSPVRGVAVSPASRTACDVGAEDGREAAPRGRVDVARRHYTRGARP
jgi:hypothetical protein